MKREIKIGEVESKRTRKCIRRRANGIARGSFEKTWHSIRDPSHAEILLKVALLHHLPANPPGARGIISEELGIIG